MKEGLAVAVLTLALAGCAREGTATQSEAGDAAQPAATAAVSDADRAIAASNVVHVYKDPNCGCCSKWVDHMRANGFVVNVTDTSNVVPIKQQHGIGAELQSCHTATVGDYAIEGHVPADLIVKLLKEKPAIAGLAVPGMPQGSPGMEGATRERYDVLTFDRAGRTTVYAQR